MNEIDQPCAGRGIYVSGGGLGGGAKNSPGKLIFLLILKKTILF